VDRDMAENFHHLFQFCLGVSLEPYLPTFETYQRIIRVCRWLGDKHAVCI